MRRLIIILLLSFIGYQAGFSQGSLYKDAVKRGMSPSGVYTIDNSKKKAVTPEKMVEYLKERGYITGNMTTQVENIFGNVLEIVKTLEFVSSDDMAAYMFSRLNGSNYTYRQLSNTGTAFVTELRRIKEDAGGFFYKIRYENDYKRLDNVMWSGEVNEGLITGKGVGILKDGDQYVYISGEFSNGLPVSEVFVKRHAPTVDKTPAAESQYAAVTSTTMINNPQELDDMVKRSIGLNLPIWYEKDIDKVENSYHKARNLTGYDSKFEFDRSTDSFIDAYEKLKYDPKNYLPKARELRDIKTAFYTIGMAFRAEYYGSMILLGFCWRSDWEKEDRKRLTDAINLVESYHSKYGFDQLFAQLDISLKAKKEEFEKKIANDISAFNKEYDRRERSFQEYKKTYMAEMCESCKIDGDKTTFPQGYSEGYDGIIIHTPATSKEDGKIVLKNGNSTKWWYVYRDNGDVDYVKIDGFWGTRRFDNVPEMVEYILKSCKELYCK